jgi:hypothetical protein
MLWKTEDWWAVWSGIVLSAIVVFLTGGTLGPLAVSPAARMDRSVGSPRTSPNSGSGIVLLFVVFGAVFTASTAAMGFQPRQYLPGFAVLFAVSVLILVVSQSRFFHTYSLEAPLVALLLGLIVGNAARLPHWLDASLRTEYYIKTGIVLLGATLPLTLIFTAGPIAFCRRPWCRWGPG